MDKGKIIRSVESGHLDGTTLWYVREILNQARDRHGMEEWLNVSGMRVWTIVEDILGTLSGSDPAKPVMLDPDKMADLVDKVNQDALTGDVADIFKPMENIESEQLSFETYKNNYESETGVGIPHVAMEIDCIHHDECKATTLIHIPINETNQDYYIIKELEKVGWVEEFTDIDEEGSTKYFCCPECGKSIGHVECIECGKMIEPPISGVNRCQECDKKRFEEYTMGVDLGEGKDKSKPNHVDIVTIKARCDVCGKVVAVKGTSQKNCEHNLKAKRWGLWKQTSEISGDTEVYIECDECIKKTQKTNENPPKKTGGLQPR